MSPSCNTLVYSDACAPILISLYEGFILVIPLVIAQLEEASDSLALQTYWTLPKKEQSIYASSSRIGSFHVQPLILGDSNLWSLTGLCTGASSTISRAAWGRRKQVRSRAFRTPRWEASAFQAILNIKVHPQII